MSAQRIIVPLSVRFGRLMLARWTDSDDWTLTGKLYREYTEHIDTTLDAALTPEQAIEQIYRKYRLARGES